MKKSTEQALLEMFGDPIEPIFGTKTGDIKDISNVGAVGVRGVKEDAMICPACGQMPIDGECGCDHSSGGDEGEVCPGCGMMVVDGECGCSHDEVCTSCGMMPVQVSSPCACGLSEGVGICGECGMKEGMCQCGMYEQDGPSKSTLKKIFKGDESFEDKVDTVKKWKGIDDPKAFASWATKKMTGHWPSEDKSKKKK